MVDKRQRLVTVESPAKATKIAGYLGDGYMVESSRGHIYDLPAGAAEIPARYRGLKWTRTGVNVDDSFAPLYVVAADKKATLREPKQELKAADELLLATDGDRESKAIAWHLMEELKPEVPAHRMVFHEITPSAIAEAAANPRPLDTDLVDAQETHRILDRLHGYEVSPVLWEKVMPKLSADRMQPVATRLVADREQGRIAFVSAGYWDLNVTLDDDVEADPRIFPARLTLLDEVRVAQGRDLDSTGQPTNTSAVVLNETTATALAAVLQAAVFRVNQVEARPYIHRSYKPFRTTTPQQEAGRKLGFTSQRTMSVAQELYEEGFITYMRTDSVTLANSAIAAARDQVEQLFGARYLPPKPRVCASKVRNAQEAHEAIRPAGDVFIHPDATGLSGDAHRLYRLIWMRTLAPQMADAKGEQVSVAISAAPTASARTRTGTMERAELTASGRTISFHGFLKVYVTDTDDDSTSDDKQSRLPQFTAGQELAAEKAKAAGHETKSPARYTESSFVAELEELEIGRPSTYAFIIHTITACDYVFKKDSALVPTWLVFAVTRLLEEHFTELVDYTFTTQSKELLNKIASGRAERLKVLTGFYRGPDGNTARGLEKLVTELGDTDAKGLLTFPLGDSSIDVRVGRYGTYVEAADGRRVNVPDDLPPDSLTVEVAEELLSRPLGEERKLGIDLESGRMVVAGNGRFGPYVAEVLPEGTPKSVRPRAAPLFRSMSLDSINLAAAQRLTSLPQVAGKDPEGVEIIAQNGHYGPYLKKGGDSRSLTSEEQIFSITLDEALAIYAAPKIRGRAVAASPLKEFGADPASGKLVVLKSGWLGPHVTDGETNAALRRDDSPKTTTPERALELLAEKHAGGPAKKPARKTTTRKKTITAAKKITAKKKTTPKA